MSSADIPYSSGQVITLTSDKNTNGCQYSWWLVRTSSSDPYLISFCGAYSTYGWSDNSGLQSWETGFLGISGDQTIATGTAGSSYSSTSSIYVSSGTMYLVNTWNNSFYPEYCLLSLNISAPNASLPGASLKFIGWSDSNSTIPTPS